MQFLFTITLFVSSALLFWVQPMFSKMVLPLLGGAPAVWNTCLVFYQATLLLGYLYVHLTSTWMRVQAQIILHLILMWSVLLIMSFRFDLVPPSQSSPFLWLMRVFFTSIGLPFFILSATAPMLQWWFGHTNRPNARNPYAFYAVSNFGSLVALLCYPFFVEPYLRLQIQNWGWNLGYGIMAILLSGCTGWMWYFSRRGIPQDHPGRVSADPVADPTVSVNKGISMRQRLRWIVLALIPSSLLLGVTRYITTDIAAVPLFWVIPLSLYLGTFVLVFARKPLLRHPWMLRAQTYLVLPLLLLYLGELRTKLWVDFPLHLLAFFVFAMVCHGELAKSKPPLNQLTEFYVWLSIGGCLGGVFTALVAPMLFRTNLEYPLMIGLACLIRPTQRSRIPPKHWLWLLVGFFAAFLLLPIGLATRNQRIIFDLGTLSLILITSFGGALGFHFLNTPKRVALGLGSFLLAGILVVNTQQNVLLRKQNFFGTLKVVEAHQAKFLLFYHGTTLHGAQSLALEHRQEPLTYFHRDSPLGQLFQVLEKEPPRSIAVFGLGVGAIATYVRVDDDMTFYEIDADVEKIARATKWFNYLHDCSGQVQVVLGDARISLTSAPDHAYALIVQDAFSSDTIPVHLLTREAFQLYKTKLTDNGMLVFHITNRYLDLEPVLANLIQDSGMIGLIQRDMNLSRADHEARKYPSVWVVAAQQEEALGALKDDLRWKPLQRQTGARLWTDDYSNILSVLNINFTTKTRSQEESFIATTQRDE